MRWCYPRGQRLDAHPAPAGSAQAAPQRESTRRLTSRPGCRTSCRPRPAGTFAALQAAPTAELAVFMHTGHDELLDADSICLAVSVRRELHMVWWNEPRPDLASEQECSRWLNQNWANIDAWIQEQGDMAEVTQHSQPPR